MTDSVKPLASLPDDPNATPPADRTSSNGVSLAEVRHVAALASLQLTAEEEPRMQRDLNAILGHVARLNGLDTTGVPAMSRVDQLLEQEPLLKGASLRPDVERPSVDRQDVMQEAPETDGRFFKVPKVIER